mgnify:CR=1 FL=1
MVQTTVSEEERERISVALVWRTTTEVSGCGTEGTTECTSRVQEIDACLAIGDVFA